MDALRVALSQTPSRFRSDVFLHAFAVGKPIGLSINGVAPDPEFLARETDWAWFVIGPPAAGSAPSAQVLQALYSDPRVVSR